MIHEFRRQQAGQVCGYPWMAGCLQMLMDLRMHDQYVLDAAKVAAMMAVMCYTTSDMLDHQQTGEAQRIKSGSMNFVPPGWEANMLNPTQPAHNYVEYRGERHREIGRQVGMPLMQIRLDSSGHNYSSARFDGQIYARSCEMLQAWINRRVLDRMFPLVMQEAMLVGLLPPRSLRGIRTTWNYDQRPHVDPVKEAMAERIRLENRTTSPQRACSAHGADFESLCREWKRANEVLEQHGLPQMLGPVPTDLASLQAWLAMDKDENAPATAA
ncbi:MAG: phage portal protein, partial [Planctomycetota bacterium]